MIIVVVVVGKGGSKHSSTHNTNEGYCGEGYDGDSLSGFPTNLERGLVGFIDFTIGLEGRRHGY